MAQIIKDGQVALLAELCQKNDISKKDIARTARIIFACYQNNISVDTLLELSHILLVIPEEVSHE